MERSQEGTSFVRADGLTEINIIFSNAKNSSVLFKINLSKNSDFPHLKYTSLSENSIPDVLLFSIIKSVQ